MSTRKTDDIVMGVMSYPQPVTWERVQQGKKNNLGTPPTSPRKRQSTKALGGTPPATPRKNSNNLDDLMIPKSPGGNNILKTPGGSTVKVINKDEFVVISNICVNGRNAKICVKKDDYLNFEDKITAAGGILSFKDDQMIVQKKNTTTSNTTTTGESLRLSNHNNNDLNSGRDNSLHSGGDASSCRTSISSISLNGQKAKLCVTNNDLMNLEELIASKMEAKNNNNNKIVVKRKSLGNGSERSSRDFDRGGGRSSFHDGNNNNNNSNNNSNSPNTTGTRDLDRSRRNSSHHSSNNKNDDNNKTTPRRKSTNDNKSSTRSIASSSRSIASSSRSIASSSRSIASNHDDDKVPSRRKSTNDNKSITSQIIVQDRDNKTDRDDDYGYDQPIRRNSNAIQNQQRAIVITGRGRDSYSSHHSNNKEDDTTIPTRRKTADERSRSSNTTTQNVISRTSFYYDDDVSDPEEDCGYDELSRSTPARQQTSLLANNSITTSRGRQRRCSVAHFSTPTNINSDILLGTSNRPVEYELNGFNADADLEVPENKTAEPTALSAMSAKDLMNMVSSGGSMRNITAPMTGDIMMLSPSRRKAGYAESSTTSPAKHIPLPLDVEESPAIQPNYPNVGAVGAGGLMTNSRAIPMVADTFSPMKTSSKRSIISTLVGGNRITKDDIRRQRLEDEQKEKLAKSANTRDFRRQSVVQMALTM